jgi:hypothetical protein
MLEKLCVMKEVRCVEMEIEPQQQALIRVWSATFNLNSMSNQECLRKFRFQRADVAYIADLVPWENSQDDHGRMRTARKRYC